MDHDGTKHVLRPQTYAGSEDKPLPRTVWCTGGPSLDWHFTSLDHAAQNGLNGGRLLTCGGCVAAAVVALLQAGEVD